MPLRGHARAPAERSQEGCRLPLVERYGIWPPLSHNPARDQAEGLGMRRRDFVILLAGAMGGRPSAVRAQQEAIPVIGYLGNASPGPKAEDSS
jgi:hypothetical protein